MKYLKQYEHVKKHENIIPKVDVNFKVGDHVIPFESDSTFGLFNDKIYTITKIYHNDNRNGSLPSSTNPNDVCDITDNDGVIRKTWFLKRFKLANLEYDSEKYNI